MPVKTEKITAELLENYKIEVKTHSHVVYIDQPPAGGGGDEGPTPLEYLLSALAGCIITIAKITARQRRIDLRGLRVSVEGDLDTGVLLGKKQGRSGFGEIRVTAEIDADLSAKEKEEFLAEVDRRCPVSDNLAHGTNLKFIAK